MFLTADALIGADLVEVVTAALPRIVKRLKRFNRRYAWIITVTRSGSYTIRLGRTNHPAKVINKLRLLGRG